MSDKCHPPYIFLERWIRRSFLIIRCWEPRNPEKIPSCWSVPVIETWPVFHAKRLLGQVTKNIQVKCWPSGHFSAKWFKGKHPETHFRDGLMHFLHSHFTVTQKFLEPRRNWSQRKPIHPKLGDRCSFANEEHTGWRSNYIMYMNVLIQMHTYVYQYICVYLYICACIVYIHMYV